MKKVVLISAIAALTAGCASMGGFTGGKGAYVFPEKREPTGRKVFVFDPKHTAWAAYDADGNRIRTGSASGGSDWCDDIGRPCRTVVGKFRVYRKQGEECKSSKYPIETGGGAKMPYCMHFHGGYSIHAAYEVPNYNASHGCIRVKPPVAKWLNENFVDVGTTVEVKPYH